MIIDDEIIKEVIDSWNSDPDDPLAFGKRVDAAIKALLEAVEEQQHKKEGK